ncbi:hypothetical protein U1Q18_032726 [Sarracenia purpurea var. burkii]
MMENRLPVAMVSAEGHRSKRRHGRGEWLRMVEEVAPMVGAPNGVNRGEGRPRMEWREARRSPESRYGLNAEIGTSIRTRV